MTKHGVGSKVSTSEGGPQSFAQTIVKLATSASKSNSGAPAYTRWINRPLGRRVAALAFQRGITPNQLTAINAAIIFPVLILLAVIRPTLPWTVLASLLLITGYVADSADGQLARLSGNGSKVGEWLDHVVDGVKAALFHAVLAVAWFRFYTFESAAWLLMPIAFGVVASTYFFSQMLTDNLRYVARIERRTSEPRPILDLRPRVLRSFVLLPIDWGVFCLIVIILPVQWLFVAVYAIMLAVNILFLVVGLARWYRELKVLG